MESGQITLNGQVIDFDSIPVLNKANDVENNKIFGISKRGFINSQVSQFEDFFKNPPSAKMNGVDIRAEILKYTEIEKYVLMQIADCFADMDKYDEIFKNYGMISLSGFSKEGTNGKIVSAGRWKLGDGVFFIYLK